jgi:hypothetical protein
MAFEVKVESEKLLQQFDDMQKRVTELGQKLPEVFLAWQRDDMKRKFPTVDEHSGLEVTTYVYPRSRKSRPYQPGSGKKPKRNVLRRIGGVRPILRPELVEQLFDRMKEMCGEAIEWG